MLTASYRPRARTVWIPLRTSIEICRLGEGHSLCPWECRLSVGKPFPAKTTKMLSTRNSSILIMSSSVYLFFVWCFKSIYPVFCILGLKHRKVKKNRWFLEIFNISYILQSTYYMLANHSLFLELAMPLLDFSPRTPLGTFSILLWEENIIFDIFSLISGNILFLNT